jgi:DNA-binding NarL/FixJ family response regulator
MKIAKSTLFVTADNGLLHHWQNTITKNAHILKTFCSLHDAVSTESLIWVDLSLPKIPEWRHPDWKPFLNQTQIKVVACSSSPSDDEGIAALEAGCSAYCHAFSDSKTLSQIVHVVEIGQVWIGTSLLQKLIRGTRLVNRADKFGSMQLDWSIDLTAREKEVALLAANGASNQLISKTCAISERTVKAHLSAAFQKLNITDRLQLALRVHGVH